MLATFLIATVLHYGNVYTFHSVDYLLCWLMIIAVRLIIWGNGKNN